MSLISSPTPEAGTIQAAANLRRCLNCGEPVTKRFCPECGQETAHRIVPLRDLIHEVINEFFSFDTRLLQSLRLLLTQPGFLAAEYVAGRRARYLSPLRLYLILSALAVWLSSRTGDQGLDTGFNLFLCFVPLLALTLAVLFRRTKRLYMEHLIFALYIHAFAALLILLTYLFSMPLHYFHLSLASGRAHAAVRAGIFLFWFIGEYVYLALALRRFYHASGWAIFVTLPAVLGVYSVSLSAGVSLLHAFGIIR